MTDPTLLAEMTYRSLPLIAKILVGGAFVAATFGAAVYANKRVPRIVTIAAWLIIGSGIISAIATGPFPAVGRWTFVVGLVTLYGASLYAASLSGRKGEDAGSYSGSDRL